MKIGEMSAEFPWGLLLVSDSKSSERIPEWKTDEDQVTTSSTALVLRDMNGVEGQVRVAVWNDEHEFSKHRVFSGEIIVPSGLLLVGDATGIKKMDIPVATGRNNISVFANEIELANSVDILVRAAK